MFKEWHLGVREILIAGLILSAALVVYYWQFISGRTFLWEDLLFYSYPSASYFAEAVQDGRFPLWISGMHNGLPFYTNLNLTAFYPPLWLLALVAPGGKVSVIAYQCYLILQLVGAGLFAYLFLRELRLHAGAALVGMVVFVFSAFMSLHIIHENVITAFLWLPLQFLFVNRIVSRSFSGGNYFGLIIATLMSFFAGFPQVVMYNSYLVGAFWLYLYFLRQSDTPDSSVSIKLKGLLPEGLKIGAVFLVVILLGAVQFIPVAENWMLSSRQQYTYAEIAGDSLPWYYLIHGLVPNFFGVSNGSGSGVPFWGVDKESIGYATWHAAAWQYWEFGFYAGQIALLALVIVAFNVRRLWSSQREKLFYFIAIFPLIILMAGRYGFLFPAFYHYVPGFSLFRSPARMGCLLDFCLAVNAALIVNAVLENIEKLNLRHPLIMAGTAYGLFSAWVLIFGSTFFPELKNEVIWGYSVRQTFLSILFCFMIASVIWFMARSKAVRMRTSGAVLVGALTFVELYLAFQHFHGGRGNPDEYYADRNGIIAQMTKMKEQSGPFRFAQLRNGKLSEEIIFPRNTGYLYPDYEALEGYVLFNLKDWGLFNSITNEKIRLDIQNVRVLADSDRVSGRVSLMQYTNSLPRVKFYHDIKVYADSKSLCADLESGRLDYRHVIGIMRDDFAKYGVQTSAPPINVTAQVHFTPKNSGEYQISYQTSVPGVIFVSESFYPGWVANGGKLPIIRTFGAFKGIVVREAGQGVITVKFSPWLFKAGLTISLATLASLIGMWLWVGRRGR